MPLHCGLESLAEFPGALHLAIGVFDGVHLGHRAVIGAAMGNAGADGRTVVLTFEPHPIRVLAPGCAPRMLASLEHKRRILDGLGVDEVVAIPFDRDFAARPARRFVEDLLEAADGRLRSISVGHDWRFGAKAAGDLDLLAEVCGTGVTVRGVGRVLVGGERVSSTRIRAAIQDGRLALASELLGRPYTVLGTVIEGRRLGRTIGFPTANLRCHSEQLPPSGVYAVRAELPGGAQVDGVANLGLRPTVEGGETQRRLEVHLFDWEGEFYGEDIEVEFVDFIRAEQKFADLAELSAQIERDAARARTVLVGGD